LQVQERIFNIQGIFSRAFEEGAMEDWQPSHYQHFSAIDIANRYFVSRQTSPHVEAVPFHDLVDPKRILASMAGDRYIHGADNEVDYYQLVGKGEDQKQVLHID
jgi:hypothetical protein